jgi:hypothetical protein
MNFQQTLMHCAANKDLIENFDRLRGTNLSRRGSPLALAIDDSTGRTDADLKLFVDFVRTYVYMPLLTSE